MQQLKRLFLSRSADALSSGAWLFAICLAPLVCLFSELTHYPSQLSAGLAMRIVAAELVGRGELPYVDFWDWTQPIVFELFKYPCLLCDFLKSIGQTVLPAILIPFLIFLAAVFSLLLSFSLYGQAVGKEDPKEEEPEEKLQKDSLSDFTAACWFAFALTGLLARFDFGELQYLLLICLLPWVLLRWYVHCGRRVHPALAVLTGGFAGLGACLDLPFVFVFLALEIALVLQSRRWRSIFSIDCFSFLVACCLYLLYLSRLETSVANAFWNWTMPMKVLSYSVLEPGIYGPLSCPKRVDVLYSIAVAGGIAFLFNPRYKFYSVLTTLMFAGFGLYLLAGDGFSHGLILVIFGASAIFAGLAFLLVKELIGRLGENNARLKPLLQYQIVLVGLSVLTAMLTAHSLDDDRNQLQVEMSFGYSKGEISADQLIENQTKQQDKVIVVCNALEPVYPYLTLSGRKPGGYLLWGKPLTLFQWLKEHSKLTGAMKEFYDYTYAHLTSDIEQQQCRAIAVCDDSIWDCFGRQSIFNKLSNDYEKAPRAGLYFSHKNHQPHEYCGLKYSLSLFVKKEAASP